MNTLTRRTARAAVTAPDGSTGVVKLPVPPLSSTTALLEVEGSGVCGTDVGLVADGVAEPTILGHHVVGRLADLGEDLAGRWEMNVGQRVVVEEYLPCGACDACRGEGTYRFCARTDLYRGGRRIGLVPTSVAPGLWGGNAEVLMLPANAILHAVPDGVDLPEALWTLPLANAFDWTSGSRSLDATSTVVVIGPGQHGLAAVVAARACGVRDLIVVGLASDEPRLEIARVLGASVTVHADGDGGAAEVLEATGGRGADLVVHTAGPDAQASVPLVAPLGTLVLAGAAGTTPLDPNSLVRGAVTTRGVRGRDPRWITRAFEELGSGECTLGRVPTRYLGLADLDRAYGALVGGGAKDTPHVVVRP